MIDEDKLAVTTLLQQAIRQQPGMYQPIKDAIMNGADTIQSAIDSGESQADIARELMNDMDTAIAQEVDFRLVKCRKGCSACCHINVDATIGEAELIVDYCTTHNIPIDTATLEKQKNLTTKERPVSDVSRCTFLTPGNTCGIYEVRPLHCRKHFVQTEPAHCDANKHRGKIIGYYFHVNSELILSALHSVSGEEGNLATMLLKVMDNRQII